MKTCDVVFAMKYWDAPYMSRHKIDKQEWLTTTYACMYKIEQGEKDSYTLARVKKKLFQWKKKKKNP